MRRAQITTLQHVRVDPDALEHAFGNRRAEPAPMPLILLLILLASIFASSAVQSQTQTISPVVPTVQTGLSTLGSASANSPTNARPDLEKEAAERQQRIEKLRATRLAELIAKTAADHAFKAVEEQVVATLIAGADASGLVMQALDVGKSRAPPEPDPSPARFATLAGLVRDFEDIVVQVQNRRVEVSASLAKSLQLKARRIEAEQMLALDRLARWAELGGESNKPWLRFSPKTAERIAQYRSLLGARFDSRKIALTRLEPALKAASAATDKLASDALRSALEAWAIAPQPDTHIAIFGLDLPVSRPRFAPLPVPTGAAVTPSYANSIADVAHAPADLANQPGAELDGEILAKAAELGFEYTRIFDFVRTRVHTDWYAGAMRGASGSLRALRGNDVDQALLLAALLRASGAPTRLITGSLEVPVASLAAQFGAPEPRLGAALTAAGIPNAPVIRGGRIAAYRIAHTWVSTYVPISDYRGSSVSDAGRTWIPLAPALKPYLYVAGQNALTLAGVSTNTFIQTWLQTATGTRSPWEQLRNQLTQTLAAQNPPVTLESLQAQHRNDSDNLKLLPLSLPGEAAVVLREHPALAQDAAQTIRLRVLSSDLPGATVALEYSAPLYQWLGRRLTLSYAPASEDDANLANAYGGLGQTPPFLVRVRPRLSLEGSPLRFGERELLPGTRQLLEIEISSPAGTRTHRQTLIAGSYAAIVLAGPGEVLGLEPVETANESVAEQHDHASRPDKHAGDGEYVAASLLYNLGARYLNEWNQSDREIGATLGTALIHPLPSVVLVLNQNQPTLLDGLVTDLDWKGVAIDAGLRPVEPIAANPERERDFMRLSALQGSALERLVFERQWAVDAISAEKGLALARANGLEILELSQGANLNGLNHSTQVRAVLQSQLDAGYRITIPRNSLTRDAWAGAVWRAEDLQSGAAGWFIAGTYAGAATTPPPDLWFLEGIREHLRDPYAAPPNLDAFAVKYLVLDSQAQRQVATVAEDFERELVITAVDASGAPVLGVSITFSVESGLSRISTSGGLVDILEARTNIRGIAKIRMRAAEVIGALLSYDLVQETGIAQELGVTNIAASAPSRIGSVASGEDFVIYSRPGVAANIEYRVPGRQIYSDGIFFAEPIPLYGVTGSFFPAVAETSLIANPVDSFGNPVRGFNTSFSIQWGRSCYTPPPTELNPDPSPPGCPCQLAEAPKVCDVSALALTDNIITAASLCARQRANIRSRPPFGAVAAVVAPNSGAGYRGTSFTIVTRPVNVVSSLVPPPIIPRVHGFGNGVHNNNCHGGRALLMNGQSAAEIIPVNGRASREIYYFRQGVFGDSICGDILRCPLISGLANGMDSSLWQFSFSNGRVGSLTLGIGALPGLPSTPVFRFDLFASDQTAPVVGTMIYREDPNPEPPTFYLRAEVARVLTPNAAPSAVTLQAGNRSGDLLEIEHQIEPPYIEGRPLRVELLADDETVYVNELPLGTDGSKFFVPRGFPVDLEKQYSVKTIVRNGTPFRMESPPRSIHFRSNVISGFGLVPSPSLALIENKFPRSLKILREIDIGRQTVCINGDIFAYALRREARVTLKVFTTNELGASTVETWRPLDDEVKSAGVHSFEIDPDDLPFGSFTFVFEAQATIGPDRGRFEGGIQHKPVVRDTLPVGHTLIKGVDIHAGTAVISENEVAIAGRGPGLRVTRTYNSSQGDDVGVFGRGWNSDLDSRIMTGQCGEIFVIGAQGSGQAFVGFSVRPDGIREWNPERGYHGTLTQTIGVFDFYAKDGTRYHFGEVDARGPLLSEIEDTNGNRISYTYEYGANGSRRVAQISDTSGRVIVVAYATRSVSTVQQGSRFSEIVDLVTRLQGPGGWRLDYLYDDAGNLKKVTRGEGVAFAHAVYEYQDLGGEYYVDPEGNPAWVQFGFRLSSAINAVNGAVRSYRYIRGVSAVQANLADPPIFIPEQRVEKVIEPDLGETQFDYGGVRGLSGVTTIVKDARRNESIYDMDRYGLVTRLTDPAGVTTTDWNLEHLSPSVITDRLGTITRRSYDANGNQIIERIEHPTAGTIERRWQYHTPAHFSSRPFIKDRAEFKVDGGGHRADSFYDQRGNLTQRRKGGVTESWTYDQNGDVASSSDGANQTWTYRYDLWGNQREARAPDQGVVQRTFDERGRMLRQTDELNRITVFEYDLLDRLIKTTLPVVDGGSAVSQIRAVYRDAINERDDIDVLNGVTTTKTDLMGRVTRVRRPPLTGGRPEVTREYDTNGNLTREVDELLRETRFDYDDSNRLVLRTEPLARQTVFAYDDEGHLTEQITREGANVDPRIVRTEYVHPLYKPTKTQRKLVVDGGVDQWLSIGREYDDNGHFIAIVDGRSNRTTIAYDPRGREILRTEPLGKITATTYDGADRKIEERRASGSGEQLRVWTYDSVGRVRTETDAEGGVQRYEYDRRGNRLERRDALNHLTTYRYDQRDQTIEEKNVGTAQTTTYGYDEKGNRTREQWPGGRQLTHTFDALDRRTESVDLLGRVERLEYDLKGNVLLKADGLGREWRMVYDALDRPTSEVLTGAGNEGVVARETRTYNIHGEIATRTDGRDHPTGFSYDSVGRKLTETAPAPLSYVQRWRYDADDHVTGYTDGRNLAHSYTVDALGRKTQDTDPPGGFTQTWTYDAQGNVLTHRDRLNIEERYSYDLENRLLTRKRDGETKLTQTYDAQGNLKTQVDANARTTSFDYDAANRRTETRRPEGIRETLTYSADGDVATRKDALNRTWSTTHDSRRRLTHERNPAIEETRHFYDLANNRTRTERPLADHIWTYAFDGANRLKSVSDPLNQTTSYRYDLAGNRTEERNARNHIVTLGYDELNRRTSRTLNPGVQRWTYDGANNLIVEETPNGAQFESVYDVLNRRSRRTLLGAPVAGQWRETSATFDANGKPLTETTLVQGRPAWTRTRQYDRQERLRHETDGDTAPLSYSYDPQGNRLTLNDSAGEETRYGYDPANRLTSVSAPAIGTTAYSYDSASQLIERTGQGGYVTAYLYDLAGRIDSITHRIGSVPTLTLEYDHNANGNRQEQRITHAGSALERTVYRYDRADRLTGTSLTPPVGLTLDTTWTLDTVGNREAEEMREAGALTRRTAYTYDLRDRLTTATPALPTGPPTTYSYDLDGNLTTETTGAAPPSTYTFDTRSRLIEQTPSGQPAIRNRYDEADRRIAREDGSTGSRYRWDGNALLEETNAVGNRLTRYHRGLGLIGTTGQTASPDPRQYATDSQGTPLALIRVDGGIAGRSTFDIWGKQASQSGEQSKLGFTGYQKEGELYQAIARFYRPGTGTFLSRDPWEGDVSNPASLNPYVYGFGNPGTFIDPDGRRGCDSVQCELLQWQGRSDSPEQKARIAGFMAQNQASNAMATDMAAGLAVASAELAVAGAVELVNSAADTVTAPIEMASGGYVNFGSSSRNEARVQAVVTTIVDAASDPPGFVLGPLERAGELNRQGRSYEAGKALSPYAAVLAGTASAVMSRFAAWRSPAQVNAEGASGDVVTQAPVTAPDAPPVAAIPEVEATPSPPKPACFGTSTCNDYRETFFEANPTLRGKVVVHHAVEQQTLARFPTEVTKPEINSLENLRGIPKVINSDVHLSKIRIEWNRFYRQHPNPTQAQLLEKATEIDDKFGAVFTPPVR